MRGGRSVDGGVSEGSGAGEKSGNMEGRMPEITSWYYVRLCYMKGSRTTLRYTEIEGRLNQEKRHRLTAWCYALVLLEPKVHDKGYARKVIFTAQTLTRVREYRSSFAVRGSIF